MRSNLYVPTATIVHNFIYECNKIGTVHVT